MYARTFAKNKLTQAVSLAVGVAVSSAVTGQEAISDEPVIEEVLVTGIRSSLKRAMDTKRDSQGVVPFFRSATRMP